jgi:hypothetical protein
VKRDLPNFELELELELLEIQMAQKPVLRAEQLDINA